jgi:hypothetical protein
MFNSMLEKLKIKIGNFQVKYEHKPSTIVVNSASIIALKEIEFKILILKDIKMVLSNRVNPDDFELY